jgi:hypothetical protein
MNNIKIIQNNSVPQWLINHLQDIFPDKIPRNIEISIEEFAFLQGQQNLIDYLISLNEDDGEASEE